jgi:hypothetical protein
MAIVTLDQLVAGMLPPEELLKVGATMEAAGIMHSLLYTAGRPGAGVAPAPGINGAALTTYAGQVPFSNPGGSLRSYLAHLAVSATVAGKLLLLDRLWHNSGIAITTTTIQAITSPTWPARDRNGATLGDGVGVALEVSGAVGAGAIANTTLQYTNSAGVGSRTGTIAWPATAVAGTFVPFRLQAGDVGVRSIQGLTLGTSYVSGTIHLVAYRLLAGATVPAANTGRELDAVSLGMPRLYDNTVPFLVWLASATTAVTVTGQVTIAQG